MVVIVVVIAMVMAMVMMMVIMLTVNMMDMLIEVSDHLLNQSSNLSEFDIRF